MNVNNPKRPLYNTINGIMCPAAFSSKCFREALDYKPKADDVFIVTYPKCGTTWMQNVVLNIFRKGKALENMSEFLKYCPFIDMLGQEGIDKMPRPGAFKTHLPYAHIPYSSEAKYVYVARNPKDCVVSLYHHTQNIDGYDYMDGKFDDFFELFMTGEVEYNDYFDHLWSWYPHLNDPDVFFTTYEEMNTNLPNVIINLARFLGNEYAKLIERDNSVFNNILYYNGFEYMQKHLSKAYDFSLTRDEIPSEPMTYEGIVYAQDFVEKLELPDNFPEMRFIRKGIIGDWKNRLTEEQSKRLGQKFIEKTKGTEIPMWFSHYDCL